MIMIITRKDRIQNDDDPEDIFFFGQNSMNEMSHTHSHNHIRKTNKK